MSDLPGYLELRELGAGNQGRVVLARHEPSGRVAAIKYLHGAEPAAIARFRDEAVLLQRVESPHVAALYEFREFPGGAAIVMEAVEGTSLRAVLDTHRTLTPEAALTVLKGSLLGLESAHRLGIVHRDYKPANVIVTAEGQSKLIDFGVAVFAGSRGGSGTPAYMSPEQWMRGAATPATDVYAATCVFFECVTGHLPFHDGDLSDLHRQAPLPVEDVPVPLRALISRGMAKEASERPPSAQSFVTELEAAATTAYGPDWESRGRAVLGGMAAGMLGGAALIATAGTTATTAATTTTGTGLGSTVLGGTSLTIAAASLGVIVTAGVSVYAVPKLIGDESPARPVTAATAPTAPSLAYMTNNAVMVNGPDGKTRKIASLSGRAPGDSLAWSADGRHLAWTTAARKTASADKIHLASTADGRTHTWDCPDTYCGAAVFRGDQLITGGRSLRLTLYPSEGGTPAALPITGLPENPYPDFPTVGPTLVDGTGTETILYYGVGTSAYGGPVAYYRVSASGQATQIFTDDGRSNVGPHSLSLTPDRRSLVYVGARRGGYCDHHESVRLADLATGRVTEPDMPTGYVSVRATWYDASGALTASFLPQDAACPDADPAVPRGPARFALRSGTWTPAGRGPAVPRFAADGSEARLSDATPPATLTITRQGTTTKVPGVSLATWSP